MKSFKNMKDYTQKYKDFTELIYKNIKYWINFIDDNDRIKMLCYIWVYYNYIGRVGYLKILDKRWKLDYYKESNRVKYEESIKKINELDQLLFYNFFSKSYDKLSEKERNKISLNIKDFIINEVTEGLFLKFTWTIDNKFEFFFYSYYEQMMNNKNLWEWKSLKNKFLHNKCKNLDHLYVELQSLK